MKTETNQNPGELNGSQVQSQGSNSNLEELKKKAEAGDAENQVLYGIRLEKAGKTEEALVWYKKASDNGEWRGSLQLAKFFKNTDKTKSDEYYLKTGDQKDDGVSGIHAFDNPIDAWNTISGYYGDDEGIGIINDNVFETIILSRAIKCLWEEHFGGLSKSYCQQYLCKEKSRSSYLICFNFFLYSERNRMFYTWKSDKCVNLIDVLSTRQWEVFEELKNLYNFNKIVKDAEKLFNKFKDKLANYQEDDISTFWEDVIVPYLE